MIEVAKLTFNPFQENTYLLFDETKECIIVDPGCYTTEEQVTLEQYIEEKELKPVRLINTHSHIDHILGNAFVCKQYNLLPEIHPLDLQTQKAVPSYAHVYGFNGYVPSPEPNSFLSIKEPVRFGNSELELRFVPGHAPGHVVLIAHEEELVINGDCLFLGSIGRTDLPGGNLNTLLSSIQSELFTLPDNYTVFCGHGPETTIGFEKERNPYFHH